MTAPSLQDIWRRGGTALGAFLFLESDPTAVEAISTIGFDYVCVCLQHGHADLRGAVDVIRALRAGTAEAVVRVPANEASVIGRVLDAGALGVIVPLVNTAADAQRAVAACRYPPDGVRSYGPIRAGIVHGPTYFREANRRVTCIPMIETAEAVDNLDEILAVPGVDALYVGPTDLALSYGLEPVLDQAAPAFEEALRRIVERCARHGVPAGIHANAELAAKRRDAGFTMVTVGTDLAALVGGLRRDLETASRGVTGPGGAK